MKKIIFIGTIVASGLLFQACSGSVEETVDESNAEIEVTQETASELESAQNLNIEVQELHDEVDAFMDSLGIN